MGKYNAYEKYKDSGVEWLGEIPEHWNIQKFIRAAFFQEGPGLRNWQFSDNGIRVICVTNITEKGIDFSSYQKFIEEEDYKKNYKHFTVKRNDLLLSSSGNSWGKVAEYNSDEIVILNTSTIRINEHKNSFADRVFLKWALQSLCLREQLSLLMTGACQPNFGPSHLAKTIIAIPPLPEQQTIANFLDYKTKQIDALITKKETLLEKLDEKRTAIISHAVTKGLDSNVPMKDSGIEWLGEIPERWEVKRLRYIGSCQNGISKGADYFGFGYPFVNYTDVYANFELPKMVSGLANSTDMDRIIYSVKEGDIFFTRTSETIEEIGITSICLSSLENATFSGFLIRVRPFVNLIKPEFSKYYFRCQLHRFFFVKEMNIVTRASLSQELLKKLPVLLPPLEEQKKIADYLDKKTSEIDLQKAKIQEAIDRLKEYRIALITNAVTGKIDVRQVPIP